MSDKKNAVIKYDGGSLYLYLTNSVAVLDPDVLKGLHLVLKHPSSGNMIHECFVPCTSVSIDTSVLGYRVPLDVQTNNILAGRANALQNHVVVDVHSVDNADMMLPEIHIYETIIDGALTVMVDRAAPASELYPAPGKQNAAEAEDVKEVSTQAPENIEPEKPAVKPVNTVPEKKKGMSAAALIGIILGALLLLALIAGIVYYLLSGSASGSSAPSLPQASEQVQEQQDEASEPEEPEAENPAADSENAADESADNAQTSESSASESAAAACTLTQESDSEVLRRCLASSPETDVLRSFAADAFASGRCDLGKKVLYSLGRHDQTAALTLGALFDPNSQNSTECIEKLSAQAVYWYETALKLGDSAQAKEALLKLR